MANEKNKYTDPDVKPTRGQESNENWDARNNDESSSTENTTHKNSTSEQIDTSGAGSSQRSKADNVGPLDSDLEQLPSEKRIDRGNLTGPGLG